MTFYWPAQVRQVRIRGTVVADEASVREADFRARSDGSRAMALTLRQSKPFEDPRELDEALDKTTRLLTDDPDLVPDEWMSYAVRPDTVEFWQGDAERRHQRLLYQRAPGITAWSRTILWP